MRTSIFVILCICVFAPAGALSFEQEINYGVDYRLRGNYISDFEVDESGRDLDQNKFGTMRLRISPTVRYSETLKFGGEIDLLSGQNFGQKPDMGTEYAVFPGNNYDDFTKNVDPRQLWVEWQAPVGLLRVGQMASSWGLGIMSNDGEGKDTVWGDAYFGDIVERILFATKPLLPILGKEGIGNNIVFALGADLVYRDDLGSLLDGDKAYQGILSVLYLSERITGGFYIAHRNQDYDNGDTLVGTGYDIYGKAELPIEAIGGAIGIALEGVVLQGETTRIRTEQAPGGVDVLGVGGVIRVGLELRNIGLGITAEAGYASGDNDSNDDTSRIYAFDPDYNVGLILFEEVLAAVSAVAAESAGNPDRVGYPPPGTDMLPSNGSVRNAYYLFPTMSYRPLERLLLNLGFLSAWSDSPFADPYLTFKAGGVPRTFKGIYPRSPHLGYEVDASVQYCLELGWENLRLKAGLQYGYFVPGKAFEDADGDRGDNVQKAQIRLNIIW